MRRLIITAITVIALTATMASSAQASTIRECGGQGYVRNITTRITPCYIANRVAFQGGFWGYGTYTRRIGAYSCRVRIPSTRSWWIDIRCTYGARVIRWQYLSGE